MSAPQELPCQTDWDRVAAAAYVAFWEAREPHPEAPVRLTGWHQLAEIHREPWRVAVKHALQTWLHCDFRSALQDAEVVREVAAMLVVSKEERAAQRLMLCVAMVPLMLIDAKVLDGTSAEIFPPTGNER